MGLPKRLLNFASEKRMKMIGSNLRLKYVLVLNCSKNKSFIYFSFLMDTFNVNFQFFFISKTSCTNDALEWKFYFCLFILWILSLMDSLGVPFQIWYLCEQFTAFFAFEMFYFVFWCDCCLFFMNGFLMSL